ncbi:hypothetical protein ABB07_10445 [Streptomyces incarnatus]|uniref:Uncharacterized protein n=1 Tax=Streptomyces incarnatus TaxID=665007 RepID=A0ABN4G973_9ACTN|nr:hypothetical protein ABB07_10445 [Streptomyces incarnatus]
MDVSHRGRQLVGQLQPCGEGVGEIRVVGCSLSQHVREHLRLDRVAGIALERFQFAQARSRLCGHRPIGTPERPAHQPAEGCPDFRAGGASGPARQRHEQPC